MFRSLWFKIRYLLLDELKYFPFVLLVNIFVYLNRDQLGEFIPTLCGTILMMFVMGTFFILLVDRYSEKELVLVDFKVKNNSFCECFFLDEKFKKIIKFDYKESKVLDLRIDYYYRVVMNDHNNIIAVLGSTVKKIPDELVQQKEMLVSEHIQNEKDMEALEKELETTTKHTTNIFDLLELFPYYISIAVCIYIVFLMIIKGYIFDIQCLEYLLIIVLYIWLVTMKYKHKK